MQMYEYGKKIIKKIKKKIKKKKKKISQINEIKDKTVKDGTVNIEIKDIKDMDPQIKNTEDEFNLSKEGLIEFAKLHSSSNKPLHQIQDFNSNTKFCPCCYLPAEQENILIPFKICENTDNFAQCGEGISLYFIFFKFAIVTLLIASIIIGSTNIYFNYKYSSTLIKFCNNYLKNDLMINEDLTYLNECKLYFTEAEKGSEYFSYDNQIFFQFSAVNIKYYRKLFKKITSNINKKFEKTIFNISIINYICLISVFINNLVFIYYTYNKSKSINYKYLRISDYSVFISSLYDIHKKFLNIKKEIAEKKEQSQKNCPPGTLDNYEIDYKEQLGIDVPLFQIKNESEEFKCFLKNKVCVGNYNEYNLIDNIVLCSKLEKYKKLEKNIEEISQKINKIKYDDDVVDYNKENNLEGDERKYITCKFQIFCFQFCKKEEKLGDLKKQKEDIYKELDDLYNDSKNNTINHFAGCAFVTFTSLKEKELFLKNFKTSFCGYILKLIKDLIYIICGYCTDKNKKPINWLRSYINFEQADEPSDIIFENLEYTEIEKNFRTFLVYVITFFIAIFSNSICFVIIAALNYLLDYINKKFPHPAVQYLTSLAISCISTGLNYLYENIFHILTKLEKKSTWTKYYLSYSIKLTIFSFINSGILPLLGEIYNPSDGHRTLINNMLMMFLLNSIYTPIRWSLNFSYFKKKIQICLLERMKNPDDEHGKTQKELNDLYELPPMNIAIKYSYIAKTLLMGFLYIPIFPFGIIISFLGFGLAYLLEKFNFCRIYKKPEMLGAKICKFYVNNFSIVLLAYGIGDFIFLRNSYDTNLWSFINLISFGGLIFIPYAKLSSIDYLKFDKHEFFKKEYKECSDFTQDYERTNPISKKEGKINYLKNLKEKEMITEKEYNGYVKDIYHVNIMQIYYKNKDKNKVDVKKFNNDSNSNYNGSVSSNMNLNKKKNKIQIQKPVIAINQMSNINSNNVEDNSKQDYLRI